MRTTLDIEDDVLQAAKELAEREGSTAGRILSQLARRGLQAPPSRVTKAGVARVRGGVPVLASRGEVVTLQKIKELMDSEGT